MADGVVGLVVWARYLFQVGFTALTVLPRRGTALDTATRVAQAAAEPLKHFEAAKALVARGVAMSPELVTTLKGLHPEGVSETEIDALVARLTVRAGLRVVGGGQ